MSINNMKKRINYYGGAQLNRLNEDKLRSLKGALKSSYQAATIVLSDGRAFKGLINPDRISMDLDCKELSIPFEDVQLNIPEDEVLFDAVIAEGSWDYISEVSQYKQEWNETSSLSAVARSVATPTGFLPPISQIKIDEPVPIGVKEGDVVRWRETNTYWLVLLRRLEETAYFRGNIYRCRHQVVLDNGSVYWAYIRGPVEQQINWMQAGGNYFNKLNYSLLMRIPATKETIATFERFARIVIDGKPWEVQGVDRLSTPGILNIALKETYSNSIETNIEAVIEEMEQEDLITPAPVYTYLQGPSIVYPYDTVTYELKNHIDRRGLWHIVDESRPGIIKVIDTTKFTITLQIVTGKAGSFVLEYRSEDGEEVFLQETIKIESL